MNVSPRYKVTTPHLTSYPFFLFLAACSTSVTNISGRKKRKRRESEDVRKAEEEIKPSKVLLSKITLVTVVFNPLYNSRSWHLPPRIKTSLSLEKRVHKTDG